MKPREHDMRKALTRAKGNPFEAEQLALFVLIGMNEIEAQKAFGGATLDVTYTARFLATDGARWKLTLSMEETARAR